ncbi:MAG: ArsR/SmtB family transcription factor [Candidatus Nanohalobium sp.]
MSDRIVEASDIFRALGGETRLKILRFIEDEERCVHEITEELEMTDSNISHHLRKLKDRDIVTKRKEGRHRYYELSDQHIKDIIQAGVEHADE